MLYCSNTCACRVCDEVVSWRTFRCVRQKYVRTVAHWTAVVGGEWTGGGRRSYISSCRLRGLRQLTETQAEGLSENNTDSFFGETRGDKWKPNKKSINYYYFLYLFGNLLFSRRFLRSAKEYRKRRRDECCVVLRALEGSPLLIKGPKRTKQGCPWYFLKEDCKGGAIREGLMKGLLILSVHQTCQGVLETFGWKSGECLELFLVLYETGD